MYEFRPACVSKAGFAFCRYTAAGLVWLALLTRQKWVLLLVFAIMLLSYLLKVGRAPLILLYKYTFERIFPSETVMLDESGMRFAHAVGGIMSLLAWALWSFVPGPAGWIVTLCLAVLKTSSALGRCSALKLYGCMKGGNCCRFGRFVREKRNA